AFLERGLFQTFLSLAYDFFRILRFPHIRAGISSPICSAVWVWNEVWAMEHVKRQIQQGAGNAYYAGMQWRGITLGHADAAALNQFDIDISKAQAPEARTWLLQNKAEFIALMLGIEIVKIG
ncbi:hypothetical protein, partial [Klebsiella pneumoniae]